MRVRLPLALLLTGSFLLAGCGQMPVAGPVAVKMNSTRALAKTTKDTATKLARFSDFEKRPVTARDVPMSDGRGAAELNVPLSPEEQALLGQLYRLHPKPLEAPQMPAGWLTRTAEHLAALHHFKFPQEAPLDPAVLAKSLKPRCYKDGEGNLLALESYIPADHYMLFGKYDLQGRILKIDIETWQ